MSRSNKTNRSFPLLNRFRSDNDGATAVIMALSASVLAGMWALSFDLGRAWNLQTEMANAADAAALACASQLDNVAGAQARAIAAAGAGGLVLNQQTFSSDGQGANVAITAANISFLTSINPDVPATGDVDSNYCEVTVTPRAVNFSFSQLVGGPGSSSPAATATAERGLTAHCLIPPLMVCNPDAPTPFDATARIGDGITLRAQGGSAWAPGNFGLLGLPQADGSFNLSASEVRDAWGRVRPLHQCFGEFVQTRPGQVAALNAGFNMRFDVYPMGTHQVPPGEPPVQSNPNYTPSLNAVKGLTKVGGVCAMNNPQGWNDPPQKYNGTLPADMVGFPRDTCAYPDPVSGNPGACDLDAGGTHWGNGTWAVTDYMTSNHPSTPVSAIPDLNGDGDISRWETYQWELANGLSNNAMEDANPICSTAPVPTQIDRRKVTAAVLDCTGLSGTQIVTPEAYVDVFLTEAMGSFNGNTDIYLEVIGPATQGPASGSRSIVRLVR